MRDEERGRKGGGREVTALTSLIPANPLGDREEEKKIPTFNGPTSKGPLVVLHFEGSRVAEPKSPTRLQLLCILLDSVVKCCQLTAGPTQVFMSHLPLQCTFPPLDSSIALAQILSYWSASHTPRIAATSILASIGKKERQPSL